MTASSPRVRALLALTRAESDLTLAAAVQPVQPAEVEEGPSEVEVAVAAAVAAWLAATTVTAIAAPLLLPALAGGIAAGAVGSIAIPPAVVPRRVLRPLIGLGFAPAAVRSAAAIARSASLPHPSGRPARRATANAEAHRRAAYLIAAARRITYALAHPEPDQTRREALAGAVEAERRYWQQHLDAAARRREAADRADRAAAATGQFRWVAVLDSRTTPDCRALHGRTFPITGPPGGLYPGQRHPYCRCTAEPG